jgi:hypothetical protein
VYIEFGNGRVWKKKTRVLTKIFPVPPVACMRARKRTGACRSGRAPVFGVMIAAGLPKDRRAAGANSIEVLLSRVTVVARYLRCDVVVAHCRLMSEPVKNSLSL